MRISDWSSDVCSADLIAGLPRTVAQAKRCDLLLGKGVMTVGDRHQPSVQAHEAATARPAEQPGVDVLDPLDQRQLQQSTLARIFLEPQGGNHLDDALRLLALSGPTSRMIVDDIGQRSEEHTSELQSLLRISYAGFCLKKNNTIK